MTDGYFCLSPDDYANMSLNMAEILRWMKDSRAQREFLKSHIETIGGTDVEGSR